MVVDSFMVSVCLATRTCTRFFSGMSRIMSEPQLFNKAIVNMSLLTYSLSFTLYGLLQDTHTQKHTQVHKHENMLPYGKFITSQIFWSY